VDVTYQPKLVVSPFLTLQHITMHVGYDHVGIYRELSLHVSGKQWPYSNDKTHVKDVKNPVQVQLPGGDRLLVVLRIGKSRHQIPSTFLDDPLLDPCHGSAIEGAVNRRI